MTKNDTLCPKTSAPKPMNCILYLRVSSTDQVKNFSLDTQREICEGYAKNKGYAVLKIFREEGESAKTSDRPELINLLDYCKKHNKEIHSVLVYRFDRLARNTLDHLAVKVKLAEFGIRLESTSEPTDDTPMGKFMETLLAALAELDNEIRAEKARIGLRKRFQMGMVSHPPLGYRMVLVNDQKIAIEDPVYYPLIQQSWHLMETGTKSLSEMAKEMNNMGITVPHGKKRRAITKQYASKLFKNRFYCGFLKSEKYNEEVKGIHTPMISEQLYYNVQKLISGNSHVPASMKHLVVNEAFPLRGVLKCPKCGHKLVSGNVHGRTKIYPKFWCPNNCIKSGNAAELEEMLKAKLESLQPNQDLVNAFTMYLKIKYDKRRDMFVKRKADAEAKILEQKQMMIMLVEGHLKKLYSDEVFKDQKDTIENKIMVYKIIANDELSNKYDIDKTVNFIQALFKDLKKAYEVSEIGQKQILLGSIYPSGLYFDGTKLLNHSLGHGFEAIQDFSVSRVALSAKKFTTFEPILSFFQPLILAYPNFKEQFTYA